MAPAVATGPDLRGPLADVESRRWGEEAAVADDVAATGCSASERSARTAAEGVLADETAARDLRIAAVLCAEQRPGTARDSVAAEVVRYARRTAERTAFATATRVPVDIVSGRSAAREGAVDSAESLAAGSEGAPTAAAVAA